MSAIDLAIVAVVSALAIALHVALFVLFRRWMDRDLALSLAGDDPAKRSYLLQRLRHAKREGITRGSLRVSSKLGSQSTVSLSMSLSISSDILESLASV